MDWNGNHFIGVKLQNRQAVKLQQLLGGGRWEREGGKHCHLYWRRGQTQGGQEPAGGGRLWGKSGEAECRLRKEMERRESHTLIIQRHRQAYHLRDCSLLSWCSGAWILERKSSVSHWRANDSACLIKEWMILPVLLKNEWFCLSLCII